MANIPHHEREDYDGSLHRSWGKYHPVHNPDVPQEQPAEQEESKPE